MSLVEPTLADPVAPQDAWRQAAERITPLGEYLGQKFLGSILESRPAQAFGILTTPQPDRYSPQLELPDSPIDSFVPTVAGPTAIPKEQWESSRDYRPGLEYDLGMTQPRAEALAANFDQRQWREALIARSNAGLGGQALGLAASLTGAALDPTNYVPILGPASKAAAVARFGTIAGNLALHGAEAATNTLLFEPLTVAGERQAGQSVGWQDVAADVVLNGAAGAIFGGLPAGFLERRAATRQAALKLRMDGFQQRLEAVNAASEQLSREAPVDVGPFVQREAAYRRELMGSTALPTLGERDLSPIITSRPEEPALPMSVTFDDDGSVSVRGGGLPGGDAETRNSRGEPRTLAQFIRAKGGLRDTGGDLYAFGKENRLRNSLLDPKGMDPSDALTAAIESGYFPEHAWRLSSSDEPGLGLSPDDLYSVLDEESRGSPRYADHDLAEVERRRAPANADEEEYRVHEATRHVDNLRQLAEHEGMSATDGQLSDALDLAVHSGREPLEELGDILERDALREPAPVEAKRPADDVPFEPVPERARAELERLKREIDYRHAAMDVLAKAAPEQPHPSVVEAGKRVGRPALEMEQFAKDAGLLAYQQPLPGREPKPEPGTPEAARSAKPKPPPTPEEKAAAVAALPPELAEIEAMRREGTFTPEDEATLAAGEEEAQRAEKYAVAYDTLVTCVLRNAA